MQILLWHNGVLVARVDLTRNQVDALMNDDPIIALLSRDHEIPPVHRMDARELTLDPHVSPVS